MAEKSKETTSGEVSTIIFSPFGCWYLQILNYKSQSHIKAGHHFDAGSPKLSISAKGLLKMQRPERECNNDSWDATDAYVTTEMPLLFFLLDQISMEPSSKQSHFDVIAAPMPTPPSCLLNALFLLIVQH